MGLRIYEPPEDEGEPPTSADLSIKPVLRIFSEEETEEPIIVRYVAQQRNSYHRPLYVSPWDPADTL